MFDDFIAPTPAKTEPNPLPEGFAGVRRMIEKARVEPVSAIVALQGFGGLRIGEALNMPMDHFDFRRSLMKIRGKGDVTRIVPMSDELVDVILPMAVRSTDTRLVCMEDRLARRSITRLGRHAGISVPVSTHMLRATFATEMLERSKNIRLVQELMGHANVTTTESYTHVSMDSMRAVVNHKES